MDHEWTWLLILSQWTGLIWCEPGSLAFLQCLSGEEGPTRLEGSGGMSESAQEGARRGARGDGCEWSLEMMENYGWRHSQQFTSFWIIWDYMGLYGIIWDYVGLYGIMWDYMGLCPSIYIYIYGINHQGYGSYLPHCYSGLCRTSFDTREQMTMQQKKEPWEPSRTSRTKNMWI